MPKPGSAVRKALMNGAREFLGLNCQFYVHNIGVLGDVACADIEPYPRGSGERVVVVYRQLNGVWTASDSMAPEAFYARTDSNVGPAGSPSYDAGAPSSQALTNDEYVYPEIPPGANPSPEWTGQNTHWGWVDGYTRSDGTYVQGHYRRTH